MGPFCRVSRKLKSGQKGEGQSRKESSSKRVSSQNDCGQKVNVQVPMNTVENQLEESVNYSSKTKCVIPVTKLQKEAGEGGNNISHRANLQKEHTQAFFPEVAHEKSQGKFEEDATLGESGGLNVKQFKFELKGSRIKGKNEIGCAYTWRSQEVHCPTITADKPWKISEGKSDENMVGVSVCAASEIGGINLKEDCKTDSMLADETSDICSSSLTLPKGLNRIKTRLGPPCDDSPDETIRGNPVHSHIVQSPQVMCGAERINKSQFLQPSGQATLPTRQLDNMTRRDSYPSRKDQFKVSSKVVQHQGAALKSISGLGDTRFQDACANNSSGMNTRLHRSMQSPQRSSFVRGSIEGVAVPLNSEADACAGFSSSETGHVVELVQVESKESHRISQKSVNIMEKTVPSRFFDNDCSNTCIAEGVNTQIQTSVFLNGAAILLNDPKQLDVIKETESIRFHALPNMSEGTKKKKGSKDIKSFSHELSPRCGKAYGYPRPHSDNDLEELLGALWARFNTAKEDVDSELAVFAADLVEILDRNADSFPEWQEKMEDLLVLARQCAFMSSSDFRRECESIVQDLVARRQDFGIGLLKQLYMRMLFILTQCTRLLQFQKEANPEEEGPFHKVRQCLKGVPSIERTWMSAATKKGYATRNIRKLLPDLLERIGKVDATFSSSKCTKKSEEVFESPEDINQRQPSTDIDKLDSPVSDCLTLLKRPDTLVDTISNKTQSTDDWVSRCLKDNTVSLSKQAWDHLEHRKHDYGDCQETLLQSSTPLKQVQSVSGGYWSVEQEHITEDLDSVICRICEEEVPTSHLEAHSFICALVDTCDAPGLTLDERLRMLANNLEKITELNTPKSSQQGAAESLDACTFMKSHEGPDIMSPKLSDNLGKSIDGRFEDTYAVDPVCIEESRGFSIFSFKPYLGARSDQGVASSSAGSGTPRSTLTTPRNSQLDLLWAERSNFTELEDISQVDNYIDLAEHERTPSMEYTFNNFSYKNLSQLASINYDLLLQTAKDSPRDHSQHPLAS